MEKAQLNYSTFDRELLAVYLAIKHFRHQLEGRQFQVWTDHKPLTFVLKQISDNKTARQQRQISLIAKYAVDMVHVSGHQNVVADMLSRPPQAFSAEESSQAARVKEPSGSLAASLSVDGIAGASSGMSADDWVVFSSEQKRDPDFEYMLGNSSLQLVLVERGGVSLWCDLSMGREQPFVPATWQPRILETIHGLGHPGI